MLKTSFLISMTMILLISCQSRDDIAGKKDALKNILADYYNAIAKKDLEKMKTLTTADFIMFDEGAVYNNESAIKSIEPAGSFTATFKFDSLNTHFDKTNASAYYFREATFTVNDSVYAPMKFLESATFEKREGKWKLRFLHSSVRN